MPIAFITGITGQDGGYLADALVADGWEVHGLVHHPDPGLAKLRSRTPNVDLHRGDLSDVDAMHELIDSIEPDEIYNLGGISSVAMSWEQPLLTARINGLGAAGLLEAAWRLQHRLGRPVHFLQASSAEIFGAAEQSPQDEATPVRPVTPYGASKAFAHELVGVYRARGLAASACILYNHESPRRPERFVTRKITMAAAHIAAGKQQTVTLGALDVRRDWGWAPDYVDAMLRTIRYPVPDDFVIATGVSRSVRDFVHAAFAHAGVDDWESRIEVDASLTRPADASEQVGDATKARRVLGWAPTVTFEQMVARMVDHDLDKG
jgi:GDPmannose 4,6-dehydratase